MAQTECHKISSFPYSAVHHLEKEWSSLRAFWRDPNEYANVSVVARLAIMSLVLRNRLLSVECLRAMILAVVEIRFVSRRC